MWPCEPAPSVLSKRVRGDHSQQRHAGVSIGTRMRWWGALTCLDLVAKPSPAPEARAGACVCSAASAHPVAACATIAGPARPCGLGASRSAQTGGVRSPAAPAPRPRARPCPLTRCRVVRGGGVMRCAGRRDRPRGTAAGLAPPAPAAPDTRPAGPRRRAVSCSWIML